jgi:type I restriction enzyme S subunit
LNKKSNIPWPTEPIESLIIDRTGGQRKILRSEYETIGAFPIIDQGKEYSNGFTNDESKLYHGNIPLVLFGDHTREVKFVNQPFALGADGVKALDPHPRLLAKFLYFFLLYSPVESRGYSRHFKFLKEKAIPIPPLAEQHRIVEILDQADQLRQQRRQADALSQRILPALFHEMFGDPQSKTIQSGQKLGHFITESNYGLSAKANEDSTGIAMLRMNNVTYDGHLDLTSLKYLDSNTPNINRSILQQGDLLFNRTNSRELVGKTALWNSNLQAVAASYLIIFRVDESMLLPEFVWAYMNTAFFKELLLNTARKAIGMANINSKEIAAFPIWTPSIEKQKRFRTAIQQIELSRNKQTSSSSTLETLFQTLLHRAFDGSLTAKWREGQADETLKEMKNQTKH